jgi:hypothetical protein
MRIPWHKDNKKTEEQQTATQILQGVEAQLDEKLQQAVKMGVNVPPGLAKTIAGMLRDNIKQK